MSKVIKKIPSKAADENQEIIIQEFIEIFNHIGYKVRVEKGLFRGGFCLLREQKLFLLNKNVEPLKKINILAKNLSQLEIEGVFIKPYLRDIIERESGK